MTQPDPTAEKVSLTAFLLARMDEDEAEAGRLHDYSCGDLDNLRFYGWQTGEPLTCDCKQPARVLADCAAKRAVVEMLSFDVAEVEQVKMDGNDWYVLICLARVYRDHPDFDPAWT